MLYVLYQWFDASILWKGIICIENIDTIQHVDNVWKGHSWVEKIFAIKMTFFKTTMLIFLDSLLQELKIIAKIEIYLNVLE